MMPIFFILEPIHLVSEIQEPGLLNLLQSVEQIQTSIVNLYPISLDCTMKYYLAYAFPANFHNNLNFLVYADMNDDECNSLDFMLHTSGIDATIPTRQWSIKVFGIVNLYSHA